MTLLLGDLRQSTLDPLALSLDQVRDLVTFEPLGDHDNHTLFRTDAKPDMLGSG